MDIYAIDEFCQRWIEKASKYPHDSLEGLFDKFFTLFVVYNRLYSAGAEFIRREGNDRMQFRLRGDRNEATVAMEKFIQQERFSELIAHKPDLTISCVDIANMLQNRRFFLHITRDDEPDWDRDNTLSDGLHRCRLKSVLDCLYQIRCNMFHGQKEFAPRQAELLIPAIILLESIVSLSLERLKKENGILE